MESPGLAQRIRTLRENRGINIDAVVEKLALNRPSAYDLESYDDEALMCISLRQFALLCELLGADPLALADPTDSLSLYEALSPIELAKIVRQRSQDVATSGEDFEDQAGWDIGKFLADPNAIWEWNMDCLGDVCSAAGVDWRRVAVALFI
jgi:hypothetical protein